MMEKENKENFIQLPLHAFKKKSFPIPQFLLESKLQRTAKNLTELKKIIQSQDYICLATISEQRNIFCVKLTSNDKLGIIQVKQVSAKNRCIYVSLNLNSSLKKQIRPYFLMKNWRIQNKIYIEDERGNGIALLEYNFAEMDLRNFINKQQDLGSKLTQNQIYSMSKDLLQNLCQFHLEETTIIDIRPETILFQDGKWFILNGDYASRTINQFGSTLSKPITAKFADRKYLSPLIVESQVKGDINLLHNPYKSDVYSLGLIIFELLTLGSMEKQQFRQMLQNRKGLNEMTDAFQFSFRQKFVLIGDKYLKIPSILRDMLAQKQQNRSYIFQICLTMKFCSPLMSKLLPPFQQFFKTEIYDQLLPTRRKIVYSQCPIEYDGEINQQIWQEREEIVRDGRGIIYYNGQRIFQGEWQNNLPNGKCMAQFSLLLSYEGYLQGGKLNGQGILNFNGSRIGQSRWCEGLCEQKCIKLFESEQIQKGYYLFRQKSSKPICPQYLIYYYKLINNNIKYIISLVNVSFSKNIIQVLKRFFRQYEIVEIELVGRVSDKAYHMNDYQLVRFCLDTHTDDEQTYIDVITDMKQSVPLLLKLIRQQKIKYKQLKLNCDNNCELDQQLLRDLIGQIPQLQSLSLQGCNQITDNTIRYLSLNKNISQLKIINLAKTKITDKSLNQLLFSSILNQIELFNVSQCKKLTSQKLSQFLVNQKTNNFKCLDVSGQVIDHHGFDKIIKGHNFKQMNSINLGMCHKIGQNMIQQFLIMPQIQSIQKISLYSTTLRDPILQTLASSKTALKNITEADLSGSINFTPLGFSKYFLSQNVINLEVLNLSGTQVTDQLLSILSKKSTISTTLKSLSLSCCYALTDKGIRDLLRPQKFIFLKILDLSRNNFSNDTLFVLSQVTTRELIELNLAKCSKMNDMGFQKLLNSENIRYLTDLDLTGTGIKSTPFSILSTSKHTVSIKCLSLSDCRNIDETALTRYLGSNRLAFLSILKLNNTLISQKSVQAIENNPYLSHKIVKISMQGCKNISDQAIIRLSLFSRVQVGVMEEEPIIKNDPRELAHSFLLSRMGQLQIHKKQIPNIQKLFESDYAINLYKLSLNWITLDACLDKIKSSNNLHNLKHLNLSGSLFQQQKLIAIFKSTLIKNLQYVDLSWTECSNSTLIAMAQSIHLNSLRVLKLARCSKVNDKGFQKYFASPKVAILTNLDLRSTLITNSTLESIFSSKYLKNLSVLCLRSCPNIKDSGFKQFFKSSNCSILKELDIGWTKLNGQIFSFMSSSKKISQLYTLRAAGLKGIQFELCKFIESSSASSLTFIDVSYSEITSKLLHSIQSSRYLNALQQLQMKGLYLNNINVTAIASMIKSTNTTKLKSLKLAKGKGQAIQRLLTQFVNYMGKIEHLCLTGLTDIELDKWKKSLKKCTIISKDIVVNQ